MIARETILTKVKQAIQQVDPEAEVILFGSQARGDARPDSDWDFLVLTSLPLQRALKSRFRDATLDLELKLDIVISLVISMKKEKEQHATMPLYQHIDREGIIL